MLGKAPVVLAFLGLVRFYEGTADAQMCLELGGAMAACLVLQVACAHAADRLQASAGYLVMTDKRMELGDHLRRMPMGYFSEGNIGKMSSVLSSDMVFIEESVTTAIADLMSHMFTQAVMLAMLAWLSPWLALAAGAVLLAALALRDAGLMTTPVALGLMLFVFDVFGPIKALNGDTARLTVMSSCLDRIEEVMAQVELPDESVRHLLDL